MDLGHIAFYLKILLAIFLFGIGLYIIIYPDKFNFIPELYARLFGLILVLRGVLRVYSAYKEKRQNANIENKD